MRLVARLVIGGVHIIGAGIEAGVHDREVLIGQGQIDDQLGASCMMSAVVAPMSSASSWCVFTVTPVRACTDAAMASHFETVRLARWISLKMSGFVACIWAILWTATEPTPPAPMTSTLLISCFSVRSESPSGCI